MTEPAIHIMVPGDLPHIEQLLIARGHFLPREVEAAMAVCDEAACRPFQEYYGYSAKVGRVVAGFIVFGPIPMTERSWNLDWIGVAPLFARQGVGRLLFRAMEKVISDLKGRQIHIDTSSLPDYLPACRFYETMGFTLEARLKDFFRHGDDKLIYVKVL